MKSDDRETVAKDDKIILIGKTIRRLQSRYWNLRGKKVTKELLLFAATLD